MLPWLLVNGKKYSVVVRFDNRSSSVNSSFFMIAVDIIYEIGLLVLCLLVRWVWFACKLRVDRSLFDGD